MDARGVEATDDSVVARGLRDALAGGADLPADGGVDLERVIGEVGVELAVAVVGEARPVAVRLELGELGKPLRHHVEVAVVARPREHRGERRDEVRLHDAGASGRDGLGERDPELGVVPRDELVVGPWQQVDASLAEGQRLQFDAPSALEAGAAELASRLGHEDRVLAGEGIEVEVEHQVVDGRRGVVSPVDRDAAGDAMGRGIQSRAQLISRCGAVG